jgi:hypothetical protein
MLIPTSRNPNWLGIQNSPPPPSRRKGKKRKERRKDRKRNEEEIGTSKNYKFFLIILPFCSKN